MHDRPLIPRPSLPRESIKRSEAATSIDHLVADAMRYRHSDEYRKLLNFLRSFRRYSPFNGLLIDVQRPGSSYVATASHWRHEYRRLLVPDARPLTILQPFGPVMFVFDVSDTYPMEGAPPLPREVVDPFGAATALPPEAIQKATERMILNAVRDGVIVDRRDFGAHLAGRIRWARGRGSQPFQVRSKPTAEHVSIPVRFEAELNDGQDGITKFATLCHELAHLYCGHLGTPNEKFWPDRHHVDHATAEFEAESAAAIAIWQLDPRAELPPYLHQHLKENGTVPDAMSLERVMTTAGLLIQMATETLPVRKVREPKR
jgi:hypothetical protein